MPAALVLSLLVSGLAVGLLFFNAETQKTQSSQRRIREKSLRPLRLCVFKKSAERADVSAGRQRRRNIFLPTALAPAIFARHGRTE